MNYSIRPAGKGDMGAVFRLIKELAEFEREPDAVEVDEAQLIRDGFGQDPKFRCFVADTGEDILGMALVYGRYSTWKGRAIHLEDLIVTEAARGQGVGGELLTAVIRYASGEGVKRVCWEVLDWNEPAIEFYESRGARVLRDWDVVQLDEQGIAAYLKEYESI